MTIQLFTLTYGWSFFKLNAAGHIYFRLTTTTKSFKLCGKIIIFYGISEPHMHIETIICDCTISLIYMIVYVQYIWITYSKKSDIYFIIVFIVKLCFIISVFFNVYDLYYKCSVKLTNLNTYVKQNSLVRYLFADKLRFLK